MEELRTCKKIDYEYYCEELFVVKVSQNIVALVPYIFNWIGKQSKKIVFLTTIIIKQM